MEALQNKMARRRTARLQVYPGYLIERSAIEPNRTPIVRLGSVIEHNRTHNKIWSIEYNRTFDYRKQKCIPVILLMWITEHRHSV